MASAPGVTLSTDVLPVALRALVALSAGGDGTFSGTADGDGLGTFGPTGDTLGPNGVATYNFDVPPGAPALTVGVTLPGNTTTPMSGYLIDPQGESLSTSDNAIAGADGTASGYRSTVQNVVLAPQAGLWRYVVRVTIPAGGSADEGTYNGTVSFSSPETVTTANVPQSASTFVAPGATTQATIDVDNGGRPTSSCSRTRGHERSRRSRSPFTTSTAIALRFRIRERTRRCRSSCRPTPPRWPRARRR